MELAPSGRAYALQLPEKLAGEKFVLLDVGGICWVYQPSVRCLYPLEAVCAKVQIPGVRYDDPR